MKTEPFENSVWTGRTPGSIVRLMDIAFDLAGELEARVSQAAAGHSAFEGDFLPQIRPAEPRFGDFQANGVLPYAKSRKTNPRALGENLLQALQESGAFPPEEVSMEIAGPGFINFRFTPEFLLRWLRTFQSENDFRESAAGEQLGRTIVVDFSSPNTAKQMHVGHIRSTVIGEALSRLLEFCGADVVRDNHIGDWGTQFGIIIYAIKSQSIDLDTLGDQAVAELEKLYKWGAAETRENPEALQAAREELVKLQEGNQENLALWEKITEVSWASFQEVYDRLGIRFDEVLGESFYRDKVGRVYRELEDAGIARESQGALVVFHPEHPRFSEQPMILRKSDGASNYATTDMATALYRVEEMEADEFIILTDSRQKDHFEQVFMTFEKWMRFAGKPIPVMRHITFGSVLGEDGKAIKTRSGEPVQLKALLDEGVERARRVVEEKNPDLSPEEHETISKIVGIEAIRYADLSQNRTSDYKFQWEKLLSFEGNTAPYLLYAIARIHSIFRKAGIDPHSLESEASPFTTDEEMDLSRKLIAFPHALHQALSDLRPHFLCSYLYELAAEFSTFYNANKVMVEAGDIRARRLLLCSRTLQVLKTGCHLLGMETLERM